MTFPLAHETWFDHGVYPTDWGFATEQLTLALLAAAVLLTMVLRATPTGIALGAVMALVAITMATGWRARWGAALLIAGGLLGMAEFGLWAVLALLVYGSHPQLRPSVSALLPPGIALRRRPTPAASSVAA